MTMASHQAAMQTGYCTEVPAHWPVMKLKRLFSVSSGDFLAPEDETSDGFPVYGGNGIRGYAAKPNCHGRTLLIGRVGAYCGNVHLVDGDFWYSEHALRVFPIKAFSLDFFKHLIRVIDLNQFANRTAQPLINSSTTTDRYAAIPPLTEQRRIAAYLDASCAAIDAAVTAKRSQLDTLNALRKSTIKRAVMTGLNPTVRMKRTDVEWIPEMPEHWRMVRVKDAMEFFNTVRVPLSAAERGVMTEKTYDYYGASGVIDKVEAYHFDGNYILIAEDGANLLTRSKPLAFLATGKFWVNNHAHILKPRFGGDDTFFVSLLESQDFSLFVTGAAQPKLTMENLGRFTLAIPRVPEQKEIAAFIRKKDAEFHPLLAQIERQIETLVSYRKSLIHECVTGQRRITDADLRKMSAAAILPADASLQGGTNQ